MLRSNRKNSPISGGSNHSSSNGGAALPTYYTTTTKTTATTATTIIGSPDINTNHSGSITSRLFSSLPFPALYQRRRRGAKASGGGIVKKSSLSSSVSHSSKCWGLLLTCCFCVGTVWFYGHHHTPQTNRRAIPLTKQKLMRSLSSNFENNNNNNNNINNDQLVQQLVLQHGREAASAMIRPPKAPTQGVYDVVVLGAGPAGLTAALFAARAGLSVLVFGSDAGSLSETPQIDNFPSFFLEKGPLWLELTKQQAAQWGASFAQAGLLIETMHAVQQQQQQQQLQPEVQSAVAQDTNNNNPPPPSPPTTFQLTVSGSKPPLLQVQTRSIIIATGATGRRLGLPLEDQLWGRSVHSCAICDGSSYVDKIVVVVGGGDAAVDGALLLARYAKQVILVHRRHEFRASNQRNINLLQSTPNIQLQVPFRIQKLETETVRSKIHSSSSGADKNHEQQQEYQVLTAVALENVETHQVQRIPCDGVFELIGSTPNTDWIRASSAHMPDAPRLDANGFLLLSDTNSEARTATTHDGIFAAGEVTDQIYRQAITAAAEGAQAAMDAERWLRNHPAPLTILEDNSRQPQQIPLQTVLVAQTASPILLQQQHQNESQNSQQQQQRMAVEQETPNDIHCDDLTQEDCITKLVNQYPVVVFSKPWCPYCRMALEALSAEGLPDGHPNLHVVDLSLLGGKARFVQSTLQSMTGRRTVPNVFVGGRSIGGGDETSMYHRQGKLREILLNAKAIIRDNNEGDYLQGDTKDGAPCGDLTQESCITQLVNQYPVVVFSKQGCPHCRRALEALALEGLPEGDSHHLHIVNLTLMTNSQLIQDQLQRMTGRRTVPNVFVSGKSIGGGSETVGLQQSGDLQVMLKKANAIVS